MCDAIALVFHSGNKNMYYCDSSPIHSTIQQQNADDAGGGLNNCRVSLHGGKKYSPAPMALRVIPPMH
jgi:hypothetical protein